MDICGWYQLGRCGQVSNWIFISGKHCNPCHFASCQPHHCRRHVDWIYSVLYPAEHCAVISKGEPRGGLLLKWSWGNQLVQPSPNCWGKQILWTPVLATGCMTLMAPRRFYMFFIQHICSPSEVYSVQNLSDLARPVLTHHLVYWPVRIEWLSLMQGISNCFIQAALQLSWERQWFPTSTTLSASVRVPAIFETVILPFGKDEDWQDS